MTEDHVNKPVHSLRIALVTPHYWPSNRGNSVTAIRLERGLRSLGAQVRVWGVHAKSDVCVLADEIVDFEPSVVHGLHAGRFSRLAHRIRQICGVPIVVTTTGTDINIDLYSDQARRPTARCLRNASATVVFSAAAAGRIINDIQLNPEKVAIIPQAVDAVEAPQQNVPLTRKQSDFIFCVPSGLRHVKNLLFCLPPLHSLRTKYGDIKLVIAGPIIEEATMNDLRRETYGRQWIDYIGELPHDQMPHLLRMCNVVINCSLSEGMSGSLLEAMRVGIPTLASNIEGNRAIIDNEVDGLLFDNEPDFMRQATRLIDEPALRELLVRNAQKRIEGDHSPAREMEAYLRLYREVMGETR